ncbi:hypothetical protein M432DRAFT_97121 [Thermoascus aurantiacus ATCC 26904]
MIRRSSHFISLDRRGSGPEPPRRPRPVPINGRPAPTTPRLLSLLRCPSPLRQLSCAILFVFLFFFPCSIVPLCASSPPACFAAVFLRLCLAEVLRPGPRSAGLLLFLLIAHLGWLVGPGVTVRDS